MKKIFQHLINSFSGLTKISFFKKISAIEKQIPKASTEIKLYPAMPRTFDFIAYFDDNELESSKNDSVDGLPPIEAKTAIFRMTDQECTETNFLPQNRHFECCIIRMIMKNPFLTNITNKDLFFYQYKCEKVNY